MQVSLPIGERAEGERVQQRCVGRHGRKGVSHPGKRLIVDFHQLGGRFSLGLAFGHDQRHMIRLPADNLRLRSAAHATQHRLVGHDQPILVHRHVFCGQHSRHAGRIAGRNGLHTAKAGMGLAGKNDLQPQLAGQVDVARIAGGARHFVRGVYAGKAASDSAHILEFLVFR